MYFELIAIIAGLLGLWFGSSLLINGGKNVARYLGVSYFFFGLAFVSIGTSVPEIAVSIAGAFDILNGVETSGLVVGNKVGSALNLITLMIGFLALFATLKLKKIKIYQQGAMLISAIVLFFLLSVDGTISKFDGLIFLLGYGLYYLYLLGTEDVLNHRKKVDIKLVKDISIAITGLVFVLIASDVVVTYGVELAEIWGVSQTIIGILLIGLGTGLPELSIAVMAARKGVMSMSMGDLIGSNVCNLLLATGSGAVISGFLVDNNILLIDIPVLFVFTLIFLYFLLSNGKIEKKEGAILIGLYLIYAVSRVFFFS